MSYSIPYIMEDLCRDLDNPQVPIVLATSVYHPTPERLTQILAQYHTQPTWKLLGCRSGEEIVGCLGLALEEGHQGTIRHIAVALHRRGEGIGTAMIQYVVATFALTHLSAETDRDAVEFYRKCGFTIQSLGEKFPGTERFLCTYSANGD